MKVVVTGGAGFIGAHVCRALLESGSVSSVAVLDDFSTGLRSNLDGVDAEVIEGSITRPRDVDRAVRGASAVIHLAALPAVSRSIKAPHPSHEANVTGTVNVLEAAREAGAQVVTASSSSVYGANPELPKTESMAARPMSPYAASKLAAEAYTIAWGHSYGMKTLAFRLFNVYGPLQRADHAYAAVVPAFIQAALNHKPLTVDGDGLQTRDFTYVGTVAQVLSDAVTRRVTSAEPVNLALGTRTSLLQLIARLESLMGRSLDREHASPRPGDVRNSQADGALLNSLFRDVRAVELERGLQATLDWMCGANLGRP